MTTNPTPEDEVSQLVTELKCLGEVAEIEGMTVEGNALHPLINDAWKAIERLQRERNEGEAVLSSKSMDGMHYEYPVVDPSEESDAGVWPVLVPNGFKIVPDNEGEAVPVGYMDAYSADRLLNGAPSSARVSPERRKDDDMAVYTSPPSQAVEQALREAAAICTRHAGMSWNDDRRMQAKLLAQEILAIVPQAAEHPTDVKPDGWFWRVFGQGYPEWHEECTGTWGDWSLISNEDAEIIAESDRYGVYEFAPYFKGKSPNSAALITKEKAE